MTKKVIPNLLWDFGLVYKAELLSRIPIGKDKQNGYKEVTGQIPEIGKHYEFELYNIVWWWD